MEQDITLKKGLLKSTFPIVGYEQACNEFHRLGTAFFINDQGVFVTAAHTFKEGKYGEDLAYYAVIDNKKVPIIEIFREREEMEKQVPPIHKDLYIGKLELGYETPFFYLDTRDILAGANILTQGFASKIYVERAADNVPIINIDDLYDYDSNGPDISHVEHLEFETEGDLLFPVIETTMQTDEESDLARIKHSKLNGKYRSTGIERVFIVSPNGIFNNGFRFDYPLFDAEPEGYSGGPITVDDKAIGMLISKNAGISSRYIANKLTELNVVNGITANAS